MEPSKGYNYVQYPHPIPNSNNESTSFPPQQFSNPNIRPTEMRPVLNYSIQTGEEFALEFMRDRVNPRMPFVPYPASDPTRTPGYMLNNAQRGSTNALSTSSTISRNDSNRSDNSLLKIKILCSFGGKILPRPSDGKLRYVGGDTRIIRIKKDISWQELWQKMVDIYNETSSVKYQLPGEDLDALVSVSCDEDLQNMMEECNVIGDIESANKLRMFLFSLSDLDDTHLSLANSGTDSEVQYVVAVNGFNSGSRRGLTLHGQQTSSANNLNELDRQIAEMNLSNNVPPLSNISSSVAPSDPSLVQMQHGPVSRSSFDQPPAGQPNSNAPVRQQEGVIDVHSQHSPVKESTQNEQSPVKKSTQNQEVEDSNVGSLRNDNQEREQVDDVSNDNDSYDGSKSDLIDLSYLEAPVPPSRVYHSERIPRGQAELNRLTKSDDSLGSQFILTHSRSDVGPQEFTSESVKKFDNEAKPPISTRKLSRKGVHEKQILESEHETNVDLVNDKKVHVSKPADTSDSTVNEARTEQKDIIIDVNDRFPRDFLSDIFTKAMMSEDAPDTGAVPQDPAGLSMNIHNHEPQHWSFFQKLANEVPQKDVSLMDQDQLAFVSGRPKVLEASGSQLPSKDAFITEASQSQLNDQSQVKVSESMQFAEMVENMTEYEVSLRNVGLPSLDEIDISSLQIIMNEDLEELRELGSGTFGTVYHGKWRGTDVAIKRIKKSCFAGRSSEQERLTVEFWSEAGILSKLHHPNVVAFYGVVQDGPGGTLATVTEFMVDGSLRHVLVRKDRHLDHRKKLIIAMDAAFGMEYLHSKNIVHFDLKCDNLLVNMKDPSRPICKVGDFGLSKIKRNTLVSGGVRGTLPWMAPELLNGSSSKVSEKVDVFSFGIVLWEILTGEEPYANMHYGAIIGGIVSNTLRPPIPKDCDGEWRKLMEQCWAPNPVVRPSFTEITKKLRVMSHSKGHGHKGS
ncbi:uncharacterized protein [Rutidosis leptorrhynchoides]|uniref:uncharacterized protein n=1 Tax=Rutidosis leptorrhynchoides TaxID=125765 RepID=UPI003A992186